MTAAAILAWLALKLFDLVVLPSDWFQRRFL